MNSFIILIEHDDDAVKLEQLLNENIIRYDVDVIGDINLVYEFTLNIKDRKIVYLLINYNNLKITEFKSK